MPTTARNLAGIWQALLQSARHQRVAHATLGPDVLRPLAGLLHRLGNPHSGLAAVHIAGSKGKGSTAAYLERLLGAAGLVSGAFTSPHLEHWSERIRVHGEPASARQLLAAYQSLDAALAADQDAGAIRFFDRLFALACQVFASHPVDWAIVEAGIGGRVDATNLITPRLSVITAIEHEHGEVLGDSLTQIAGEKAGIIKPGVAVLIGALPDEARRVVVQRARQLGAPLIDTSHRYRCAPAADGTLQVDYRGARTYRFSLPLADRAGAANAVLALAASEQLAATPGAGEVSKTFAEPLPGRCERFAGPPPVLLDCAHTPASAANLATVLDQQRPRPLHLLIGLSDRRHLDSIAAALAPAAARAVITNADRQYSVAPAEVAAAFRAAGAAEVVVERHLGRALAAAAGGLGESGLVCVSGSTYLVGRVRARLRGAVPGA